MLKTSAVGKGSRDRTPKPNAYPPARDRNSRDRIVISTTRTSATVVISLLLRDKIVSALMRIATLRDREP